MFIDDVDKTYVIKYDVDLPYDKCVRGRKYFVKDLFVYFYK